MEVEGSVDWYALRHFAEQRMRLHRLTLDPQLPEDWSMKVGGHEYPEMWLRYYAMMRHFHACMVMASDYANKATKVKRPIVRSYKRDLQLIDAHTRMAQFASRPVHRKWGREA